MPAPVDKTAKRERQEARIALKDSEDVKKFVAKCVRLAYRATIRGEEQKATAYYRLVNMSSQLNKIMETSDLTSRIRSLEKLAKGGKDAD